MNSQLSELKRTLDLAFHEENAILLLGPRKVGKTTLLRQKFPRAKWYDLLKTDKRTALSLNPALLREEVLAEKPSLVILDEIQKVPALLDEVHWCLENTNSQFILCSSSARKLRRHTEGLLGGRALRTALYPLTVPEIPSDQKKSERLLLNRILNHGLIPRHFLVERPEGALRSYVLDYLQEEIHQESLVRNLPAFSRFLDAVALTHGQLINYSNIARECGVSSKTVREYYQILEDTLLGHRLSPWRKSKNRRLIETEKFYLFDVGVVRALKGMPIIQAGTTEFGQAFEHFLLEEIRAYLDYQKLYYPMSFWRTSTGFEVDLLIGDGQCAIEFKAKQNVNMQDTKGLQALLEEQSIKKALIVSLDETPRKITRHITIYPWLTFSEGLWSGEWLK